MIHLPPPTDDDNQPLLAGEVFELCVSMVRTRSLKAKLRAIRPAVESEATDYNVKALGKQLWRKQPQKHVGSVEAKEIENVYTQRMVPKTSTGRPIYDRILSAPSHGKCPLCGLGTVNTLDHYLPKSRFPVFSVTPNNLVPACERCQGAKGEYYSTTEGDQLIHPYFDELGSDVWLAAEVIEEVPAGFRYFAAPPDSWPQSEQARVQAHLKQLKLPKLFAENAGSRLADIRFRLADLHRKGGVDVVRVYLRDELTSIEANHLNSWVAAMYRAAIESDWFCNGGFLET